MPAINLKDFGKDGGGIIAPAVQWRFRMAIQPTHEHSFWTEKTTREFTISVMSCDMDFTNNLLGFMVRQPVVGSMLNIAVMIAKEGLATLTLDSLDAPTENANYTLVFRDLTTMEHYSKYDYALSDPVTHGFKFKYKTLEVEQKLVFKH